MEEVKEFTAPNGHPFNTLTRLKSQSGGECGRFKKYQTP